MKLYLLLIALLLLTACHRPNTTSNDPDVRKMPFDNSVFLSIPHKEEQSLLRRKLLNEALNNELEKTNKFELRQIIKIEEGDQFKFVKESYTLSASNLIEYQKMKANAAEVVVSYNDHLEIYFVPTGIRRDKAFDQLGLSLDSDSNSYWVETPNTFLLKNKTYYIVNATKVELKENDVYFNREESFVGSDFNQKISTYDRSQIIELKINADYFVKETSYVEIKRKRAFTGRKNCDWEIGDCGQCTFKMETPTGGMVRSKLTSSELIDFDIIINGRIYPLIELKPLMVNDGNFLVTLDLKKMINTDMASIEFRQNQQHPVTKNVNGIEYSGSCSSANDNNIIDITPSLKINLSATILGRNLLDF